MSGFEMTDFVKVILSSAGLAVLFVGFEIGASMWHDHRWRKAFPELRRKLRAEHEAERRKRDR